MEEEQLRELVNRACAGDEGAQDELVRRYAPTLRATLRGRLGPDLRRRFETEDVLQSSLGVALRDLPAMEFRGADKFEGWLIQAARRQLLLAIRRNRAGRRDVSRERPLQAAGGQMAAVTTPTHGVEREEVTTDIRKAVTRLEPEERRIVELHSYEGLTFGEIARVVGLPSKDAARDRYRRALRKMGPLLRQHREP